jgi:hypothetical protein
MHKCRHCEELRARRATERCRPPMTPTGHSPRPWRTRTSPQWIVNLFSRWFAELGFSGCSSHSGRRTFLTNAARKIPTIGGSLRDIQALTGHSILSTIPGGFRRVGSSQLRAEIIGKTSTCRKRQIEAGLVPNSRPSVECRIRSKRAIRGGYEQGSGNISETVHSSRKSGG